VRAVARVIVVGAGTFGASLAWRLARRGDDVVLVDQFGPGDPRATSGGESRLIRSGHGADGVYTAMARRARVLWRELEAETGEELLVEGGLCWFAHGEAGWEADSAATMAAQGIPVERLSVAEAAARYPSFGGDDLAWVLHEPEAGVLRAQRAVQALARAAAAHGARVLQGRARPEAGGVVALGGERLEGDRVVWACGGWLARLFPEHVALSVTCQELCFFDGGPAWRAAGVPAWVDYDRATYGTWDFDGHGVKAAWDEEGPPLDPDAPLPAVPPGTERLVRGYLADRFPALARAPLTGARTCRYELSADSHFIAAPLPDAPGTWLVGGGSGHGFKHGPAIAERVLAAWDGDGELPPRFALGERAPARSMRTAGSGVAR
jgi:glycine/D-amino acid oxidase-like deaminating enzyme